MTSPESADQSPEVNQIGPNLPDFEGAFYKEFFLQASTGNLPIRTEADPEPEPTPSNVVPELPAPTFDVRHMPSWHGVSESGPTPAGAASAATTPAAETEAFLEDDYLPAVTQPLPRQEADEPISFLEGVLVVPDEVHKRRRPIGRIVLAAAVLAAAGGTGAVLLDKAPHHTNPSAAAGRTTSAAASAPATPSPSATVSSSPSPAETPSSTPSASATPSAPVVPPGPEAIALMPDDGSSGMEFTLGNKGWLVDTMGDDEVLLTPPDATNGKLVTLDKKVTVPDSADGKTYVVKVDLNSPSSNNETAKSATVYVYSE